MLILALSIRTSRALNRFTGAISMSGLLSDTDLDKDTPVPRADDLSAPLSSSKGNRDSGVANGSSVASTSATLPVTQPAHVAIQPPASAAHNSNPSSASTAPTADSIALSRLPQPPSPKVARPTQHAAPIALFSQSTPSTTYTVNSISLFPPSQPQITNVNGS